MKKRAIFLTLIFALSAFTLPSYPASAQSEPYINSLTATVIDAETGTVLFDKNKDKLMHPASITKIMTAMLAIENMTADEVMTTSHNAVYSLPYNTSHIALFENEQINREQALYALGIESANDASNVIAEHICGSNAEFGKAMTGRAREIGAVNTTFTNPHGLPETGHMTTAYDMALITREALKLDGFADYFSTNRYDMPPTNERDELRQFWNSNDFINGYEPCEGLVMSKTGWTEEARHTLVTAAKRNGTTLICVVMYSEHQGEKYDDTRALLDYCFANFAQKEVTADILETKLPKAVEVDGVGSVNIPTERFLLEGFTVTAPVNCPPEDLIFRFGCAAPNSDKTLATVTVEAFYEQGGAEYRCGAGDISVIVNSDDSAREKFLMLNNAKRIGLTLLTVLLWLLIARLVYIAIRQLIIIENRRRIREKRRMENKRKYRKNNDENGR